MGVSLSQLTFHPRARMREDSAAHDGQTKKSTLTANQRSETRTSKVSHPRPKAIHSMKLVVRMTANSKILSRILASKSKRNDVNIATSRLRRLS
jgi:hypothetical protein